MEKQRFSFKLEAWLKRRKPKNIANLNNIFAEKSFVATIFILMAFAAIPIPTGGITHFLEIIAMLIALEMIIGFRSIWLPKNWM